MTNRMEGRKCLVTYRVGNGRLHWNILGATGDESLEGLNLMLAQRKFLAPIVGAKKESDVNIISCTDLFTSGQADLAYLEDSAIVNDYYK